MKTIQREVPIHELIDYSYPSIRTGLNKTINSDSCPIPPLPAFIEDYANTNPKYGKIDKSFIYIPIHLTQNLDDLGIFTDTDFIPSNFTINTPFDYFIRLNGLPLENYFDSQEYTITGTTESNVDIITSYSKANPYIIGLNMSQDISISFDGVLSFSETSVVYVLGGNIDSNGKYVNGTGVKYETFFNRTVITNDCGQSKESLLTTFEYKTKGIQNFNGFLSALIKDDKLFGVVEVPRIDNDVLVDRGSVNVMERHLRLSEIDSVGQLVRYSNEYYNVKIV